MAKETKQFQAEVQKILDLMIHSLYSQKEIFLRELISNSSDAIDKLRFESLSHPEWNVDTSQFKIQLVPDVQQKTLKIIDNGIGMDLEEVEANIGTIARSGTGAFIEQMQEAKDRPELIGQFGVGFYSSFMVASKVVLHTQKAGETMGVVWSSTGDGTYTLDSVPRAEGTGTTITLHFKDDLDQDFTTEWVLKAIVKKYSDFISFPIELQKIVEVEKEGEENEEKKEKEFKTEWEVINSQKALWLRSPKDIKDEEYNEFYRHISHDWTDPRKNIHFKAEGTQEFSALFYVPSQLPLDFQMRDSKWGPQLFVKRVFIMDHCEELIPTYFRFVKGLVDSSDLSLNVSREILQQDRQVQGIQKAVTSKLLSRFKEWMSKEREDYEGMWKTFGPILKEGIHADHANKYKLIELSLFRTVDDEKWTSLAEYVDSMKDDQKSIFYISGDRYEELQNNPLLERFKQKGFKVLALTDPIDEWVTTAINKYKDFEFQSILDENLDIDTEEEKKKKEEKLKKAEEEFAPVLETFKTKLKERLKDARLSKRLTTTPVCLVTSTQDPTARMERIMGALGQEVPKTKRILEINPDHKVIQKMKDLSEEQKEVWARVLFSQALLQEGSPVDSPVDLSQDIAKMMEQF